MPQGSPTHRPRRRADHPAAPQPAAADRPHRRRQGEVDRRLRPRAARLEPGLVSIGVFQFVKSAKWRIGEQTALERLGELHDETGEGGPVEWHKMGSGWSWSRKAGTEEDHAADAAEGWAEIKRRLAEERHDLYVLDEFTYPMKWGWVDVDDVVDDAGRPARPPARRHHRPPRRPAADRGRRPGHRDDQGQAPDGRRPEGPARASSGEPSPASWSPPRRPATARPPSPPG